MSIVKNHYFRNEIFIPKAKPSITDDTTAIPSDLLDFINEYEEECLIKCLGPLYYELRSNLDFTKDNLLKDDADEKWDWLLNGKESYVDSAGKTVSWRGLRFKSNLDGTGLYNKSLIAFYIYFFYEQDAQSLRGTTGHHVNDAKNAVSVSVRPKAVKAWRKFVEMVQGPDPKVDVYLRNIGYGIDYHVHSEAPSLYGFIKDMNANGNDYYPSFEGKRWENINYFDL